MLNLINRYKVILIIILLIFTSFLFIYFKQDDEHSDLNYNLTESEWENTESEEVINQSEEVINQSEEVINPKQENKEVPIFICGEIENPGVYYIDSKAIINDLIIKAGGFTKEADQMQVNLAGLVASNEKIYIPKCGEKIDKMLNSYENERGQILESKVVNINLADSALLDTLPGIGATRAATIVNYREENGSFKTIEELKEVPGIGEKIYESLKESITVE